MFYVICFLILLLIIYILAPNNSELQNNVENNTEDYSFYENSKASDSYNRNKTLGSFTNITKCNNCNAIDEYWSQHPADACPYCGGYVQRYGSAIYISGKWYYKKENK